MAVELLLAIKDFMGYFDFFEKVKTFFSKKF